MGEMMLYARAKQTVSIYLKYQQKTQRTNHDEQRGYGEERAPRDRAESVLDRIDGARSRPKDEQLHVVEYKRDNLQEATRSAGQTLEHDVAKAWISQCKVIAVIRTHVRKNVEALGKFWASSDGIDAGLLTRSGSAAMIPDERVTIKNEC